MRRRFVASARHRTNSTACASRAFVVAVQRKSLNNRRGRTWHRHDRAGKRSRGV